MVATTRQKIENDDEQEAWKSSIQRAKECLPEKASGPLVALLEGTSGHHHWTETNHPRPTFCNYCREKLNGVPWHGYTCDICKVKAHRKCRDNITEPCKWTHQSSIPSHLQFISPENSILPHQWMEGNLPMPSKCSVCEKPCGSKLPSDDFAENQSEPIFDSEILDDAENAIDVWEDGGDGNDEYEGVDVGDDQMDGISDSFLETGDSDATETDEDSEFSNYSFSDDENDEDFVIEENELKNSYEESDDEEERDIEIDYIFVDFSIVLEAIKFCRKCGSEIVDVKWEKPAGFAISKTCAFFETLKTPYLRGSAHYSIVKTHIEPTIDMIYDQKMSDVRKIVLAESQNNGGIHLSGDAMYSSPGYCANFCRYAILDVATNFVIGTALVGKTKKTGNFFKNSSVYEQTKLSESSKSMEPKGLEVALNEIQKWASDDPRNAKILSITTDRDATVGKILSTKFPLIRQFYDLWHYGRNLQKAIWKKLTQKQWAPVRPWLKPLINQLYYSLENSDGDGKKKVEKFLSFFLHCQNVHSRFKTVNGFKFTKVHKCGHGATAVSRNDYFDSKNSVHKRALALLWGMCATTKRLKALENISPFFATSEVESFNSVATLYHTKELFFKESYPMRVKISVIHWNHLKKEEREGRRPFIGKKSYFNKSSKEVVWKSYKARSHHYWRREVLELVRKHG
ncbi:CBN-DGK-4 protein [Caenorhabditis brenneri]|uniref:CBN-DGK-4 protein n=1 Tax=Caenorhabditis brenneri TaxID=135651 RepID=G0PHP1_CAEBE|nr:CBN-DGK-4 protein [Caenorhabditis brenneri]